MGKLTGKVAVVTGASKGIGAAIAKAFGAAGVSVVANYASDKAGAERVVAAIASDGGKAVAVQGDMAKAADVKRLFAETRKAFGSLDVLVNNAGVYAFSPIAEVTEEAYRRQFDTNVLGPMLAVREALDLFGAKGGSIINVGSVVSTSAMPGASIYASTKGALDTLTFVLAKELGPRGIRVNVVAPGAIETEGTRSTGLVGSDWQKQIIEQTPLGRFGQPDDVAGVALFLASDDARWVTGERIMTAGGFGR